MKLAIATSHSTLCLARLPPFVIFLPFDCYFLSGFDVCRIIIGFHLNSVFFALIMFRYFSSDLILANSILLDRLKVNDEDIR
jgi:hypothetical protein